MRRKTIVRSWNYLTYTILEIEVKKNKLNYFEILFVSNEEKYVTPKNISEYYELVNKFSGSEGINGVIDDSNKLIYYNE
ncbi:hypothetical protein SAMN05421734_101434 [Pelagirhabdus alkalitolerans]|uniref:Uncharacterized protein n=1 Tax=Pelagirhabdus alkalitolerans TaxID=1612202 RepID=A0A1G6GRV6_9BACI|nr:hypothetical protein [Pelagirhabdus alkalitolerans]SDB84583.1 hypothetical protein SAMN05421734_101434 [Pelagirhabdus alkalitolerans]